MNSNPYIVPEVAVCLAALVTCTAWAWLSLIRQPAAGKHARTRAASAEASQFAAGLRGSAGRRPPEEPYAPPGERWWKEQEPPSQPERAAAGFDTSPGVMARVRDALLPDAWRPLPAVATFTPADPDVTCTDLPAVDGAPQYLAAPQ